jgi:hypothetical protein
LVGAEHTFINIASLCRAGFLLRLELDLLSSSLSVHALSSRNCVASALLLHASLSEAGLSAFFFVVMACAKSSFGGTFSRATSRRSQKQPKPKVHTCGFFFPQTRESLMG